MQAKYLYFLVLALIGIVCLTPIMAQEENVTLKTLGITPFTEDTMVTIDGISFNIPKGYGEYNKSAFDNETISMNKTNYIQSRHEYKNESLDSISIVVYRNENKSIESMNDIYVGENQTKKDIKGNTGYLSHEKDTYTFKYVKDKKVIVITVKDESILPSIIV